MVSSTLWKHGQMLDRTAGNDQMSLLVTKPGSQLPLYLMLACDELRLFGVFESLTRYVRELPGRIALKKKITETFY